MNDNPSQSSNPAPATTTSMTSSGSKLKARSAAEVTSQRRKFTNLANGRMRRALLALQVVGNISKLSLSKDMFSEQDAETMIAVLQRELERQARRLRSGVTGHQLDVEFDLDGGGNASEAV